MSFVPIASKYKRRIIMIVAAADQEVANGYAAMIDPDIGGDQTFMIPLSASGNEPATHYLASVVVTDETLGQIEMMQAEGFPTATIHRGQNNLDHEPDITRYTMPEVLDERSLQKIGFPS